jgi:hypothetical protein
MHPFATDSPERKSVMSLLALASVVVAWVANRVVHSWQLVIPWWAGAPSLMGTYYLLCEGFEVRGWRRGTKNLPEGWATDVGKYAITAIGKAALCSLRRCSVLC